MISIIVPIFNRKALLSETLLSVLNQTSNDWECIMVDDGSIDGCDLLALDFCSRDARFKYIKRDRHPKGASTCRNIGAKAAKGNWLMFLDSDDLLDVNCIENRMLTALEYSNYSFLVFNSVAFDEKANKHYWNIETDEDDLTRFLRLDGVWNISSLIYNKDIINPNHFFNESLPFLQDWELAIRLLLGKVTYKKFFSRDPDVFIRRHNDNSISQKGWNSNLQLYRKFIIIKSLLELLPLKERELRENLSAPLIKIVKEFLLQKQFRHAFMLTKHIRNEFHINNIDVFYLFVVHVLYLGRRKNFFVNIIYHLSNTLTIRLVNKKILFPQLDILKHQLK